MSTDRQRALIAAVRKVAIAGLILLVVWLVLLALRAPIHANVMKIDSGPGFEPGLPSIWNWSMSLYTGKSVSSTIGQNLGVTMFIIALIALMSLVFAGVLLLIGALISRITQKPCWLVKLRGILRLVLVSGGAGIPAFLISVSIFFFAIRDQSQHLIPIFWSVFFCSMPLTWMLVQTGHGVLTNQIQNIPGLIKVWHVSASLFIRLFKLVGLIIVIAMFEEQLLTQPGLGRLFIYSLSGQDFPIVFGVAWVFVIIVVLAKLIAELIEVAYNYSNRKIVTTSVNTEQSTVRQGIPKGWLIFSLGLCAFIILVAIFAPLIAPYGMNDVHLMDRLSSPSAKYLLGTDQLGRDILSRLLYGIRIDVLIGLGCAVVLAVVAAGWGTLAACCRKMNNWAGDTLEDVVMLPREIMSAVPWLVLLLFIRSFFVDSSIILVAIIAGLVMLPRTVGMIQESYRSAPNRVDWLQSVLKAIPMVFLFTVAGVMIYVSTISYLGWGVPPGTSELGSILSSEGRQYLLTAPWIGLWPGFCLTFIITVFVMTGDALLERLNFRSKAVWSKTME